MNGPQVGDVVALAGDYVMKDLAQPGGHRPHFRAFLARGKFHGGQPFVDELPGEVDVRAFRKSRHHLGQAEFGNRTQLLQARQAADDLLDGESNLLLHFLRPQGRRNRIDLHLDRGGIGKSVDVQVAQRQTTQDGEGNRPQDHQESMAQRKINDPVEHGLSPHSPVGCVAGPA